MLFEISCIAHLTIPDQLQIKVRIYSHSTQTEILSINVPKPLKKHQETDYIQSKELINKKNYISFGNAVKMIY